MARTYIAVGWLLFAASIAFGCDRKTAPEPAAASPSDAAEVVAKSPNRIVSLAPSVTETVFALGRGDRIVAVTRFCDYPAAAAEQPKIGGLTDVDVEMVISLKPDLVVGVDNKTAGALDRTLRQADIDSLFLPVETLEDVRRSITTLGDRLDAQKRADELNEGLKLQPTVVADGAPSVLVLLGSEPWIGAGAGTFADEILVGVGAKNALSDAKNPYPNLDAERLGALAPDIVIDTSFGEPKPIPMLQHARVVRIDPALMRPGPRLADAIAQFRKAVAEADDGD